MEIRLLKKDQLPIVQDLAHQIWPSTYSNIISEAQMKFMLDWMYNLEKLESNFDKNHFYFSIFSDNQPIGFTDLELHTPGVNWMKIQKIYLLPNKQGLGIGKMLMDHAELFATQNNIRHIHLQVNRNNKAVLFYKNLGYVVVDEQDFDIGNGYFMNDFVMQKDI